ncbi:MAG: glycosyltransferase family 87 protein [Janthinobacterium lividum]
MHSPAHSKGTSLRSWNTIAILLILAVFAFCGIRRGLHQDSDDLSSSFIGCRLIAKGQVSHLYAHDPKSFAEIGPDAPWQDAADEGGFEAYLHPYVQTPLWAWSLRPLCTQASGGFYLFQRTFTVLMLCSFAACIWLVAFFWARSFYNPFAIALICLAFWFAEPFQYALSLMQTHVLFFLLTLLSLVLAERGRPIFAGILLALAAAVKITPAALLIYWLLTRRWKAAASMAAASAVLWIAAYLAVGPSVMQEYRATLDRVSHVLLLSQNNQSFAAWIMSRAYPAKEVLAFNTFVLPGWVRVVSSALFLLFTCVGGLIDRRTADSGSGSAPGQSVARKAPIGAMVALVAATIFAPISWTHYSIILVAPLMILLNEQILRIRERYPALIAKLGLGEVGPGSVRQDGFLPAQLWIAALVGIIALLNYQPIAADALGTIIHSLTIVRSHFYAEVLCLLTLIAVAYSDPLSRHKRP